ncbi:MAG: hypothetical protein L3K11_08390 [Thermoplasmata archaeon]|nr:hypothetical protein [Thermoplasmata archaeon]
MGAEQLADTLERPSLHETLLEEEVTLIATYADLPSPTLRDAFHSVLRLEQPEGRSWEDALLTVERGAWGGGPILRAPLRERWSQLGLARPGLRG